MNKPIKLSRKQITEGLKQAPIEHILIGAHNADKVNLTKKQKDFARKVAEGKPKAQAYRESYNSNAKPATQSNEGHKLTKNPAISAMIEAFTLANQAREYLIPAQIRTMAIQNLVSIAVNEGEKTSNKLKALELIGKMSEVSLFNETKTHLHLHSSADIKGKLIEGLRQAFSNSRSINDLAKRKAESLLIELSEARPSIEADISDDSEEYNATRDPSEIPESATPLHHDPQKSTNSGGDGLHSNSLKQSDSKAAQSLLDDLTITAVIVTTPSESSTCASIGNNPDELQGNEVGEGVINSGQESQDVPRETPPLSNSNEKG
jgi:hypothetical protein